MIKNIFTICLFCLVFITPAQIVAQKPSENELSKPTQEELDLGKSLYIKYSCKSCHGKHGVLQGDLTQAYKKYSDDQLREYISDPRKFNNYKMPVFAGVISAEEYKPLIEYIKHLGKQADSQK